MYRGMLCFYMLMNVFFSSSAQTEIPLHHYFRTLKSVEVEINHKTYQFLFDTGAGITMVSPAIVRDMQKAVYGNYTGFRMSGERVENKLCDSLDIKIGGITFFHPYVGVFDIMSLLPEEFERVDGIISLKTFENHKISLNLDENKLRVETEDSFLERVKNMQLIPSRFTNASGAELNIFIGISNCSRLWWFLFDTGNITQTKISSNIARDWGISCRDDGITELGSYSFQIAGDSIAAPAMVDHIIYDGALSYDFIRQSEYAISLPERKIWIGKTGQEDH